MLYRRVSLFDFETTPGKPPMLFVLNYSHVDAAHFPESDHAQMSSGLSHEISETYNDPFVAAAGLGSRLTHDGHDTVVVVTRTETAKTI